MINLRGGCGVLVCGVGGGGGGGGWGGVRETVPLGGQKHCKGGEIDCSCTDGRTVKRNGKVGIIRRKPVCWDKRNKEKVKGKIVLIS